VTDVDVIALNDDGTPRTVRISGECANDRLVCTYVALIEDHGEPPFDDRFGILVVSDGEIVEHRSLRVIRAGNIHFRGSLTTTVNGSSFRVGDVMNLAASLVPDPARTAVDAYLVVRLPNGHLMSWTGSGLVNGLAPIRRNLVPVSFNGVVAQLRIPPGAPAGVYSWLSALTLPGTLTLVSEIAETRFTIVP
jgi:hypothetical protein